MKKTFLFIVIITSHITFLKTNSEITSNNNPQTREEIVKNFIKQELAQGTSYKNIWYKLQSLKYNTPERKAYDTAAKQEQKHSLKMTNHKWEIRSNKKGKKFKLMSEKLWSEFIQNLVTYQKSREEYKAIPEYKARKIFAQIVNLEKDIEYCLHDIKRANEDINYYSKKKQKVIDSLIDLPLNVSKNIQSQTEPTNDLETRKQTIKTLVKQRWENNTPLEIINQELKNIYEKTLECKISDKTFREWWYEPNLKMQENNCFKQENQSQPICKELIPQYIKLKNVFHKAADEDHATPECQAKEILQQAVNAENSIKEKLQYIQEKEQEKHALLEKQQEILNSLLK